MVGYETLVENVAKKAKLGKGTAKVRRIEKAVEEVGKNGDSGRNTRKKMVKSLKKGGGRSGRR